MSDQRSDAPLATGAEWLARFLSKRGMGACICEGQEIHAAVSEIDHLRAALKRANDQAEPKREPLSDEQIAEIAPEAGYLGVPFATLVRLTRAVERAHGIGGSDAE